MAWWFILCLIWLGLDLVILLVIWCGWRIIRPHFSNWWKRVIADDEPDPPSFY